MRERIAVLICVLTLVGVTALSWVFAVRHNPGSQPAMSVAEVDAAGPAVEAAPHPGRAILEREGCLACHSIEGVGNPRNPLDRAAGEIAPNELEGWIAGTGVATNELSSGVLRRKQRYQKLAAEEMAALIGYLEEVSDGEEPRK